MSRTCKEVVDQMMENMQKLGKWNFEKYKLKCAASLQIIQVDWNLLRAAAACWDPQYHVFRFGSATLCPTHEDFCGIMGITTAGEMIRPSLQPGFGKKTFSFLGMKRAQFRGFIHNRRVNIVKLLKPYLNCEEFGSDAWCNIRDFLLCLGLLSVYFMTSPGDGQTIPDYLIDVVFQLRDGANPVPTILAETFAGLSAISKQPEKGFRGSPHLLYVWLCSRLCLVDAPLTTTYELDDFCKTKLQVHHNSVDAWSSWLHSRTEVDIDWEFSVWGTKDPVMTTGYDYVQLLSMTETSFYIPSMFSLQLKISLDDTFNPNQLFPQKPLTTRLVKLIADKWGGREKIDERGQTTNKRKREDFHLKKQKN